MHIRQRIVPIGHDPTLQNYWRLEQYEVEGLRTDDPWHLVQDIRKGFGEFPITEHIHFG